MSEEFYITLPSHSNRTEFPQNQSNHFKIRLPHPIRLQGSTMVDKIPWDTCVIALIFGVFKMEFSKSTVIRFKMCCLPPLPQYNVETLEK